MVPLCFLEVVVLVSVIHQPALPPSSVGVSPTRTPGIDRETTVSRREAPEECPPALEQADITNAEANAATSLANLIALLNLLDHVLHCGMTF
jgi:hypothetical protein